jgi:hypothetical protein
MKERSNFLKFTNRVNNYNAKTHFPDGYCTYSSLHILQLGKSPQAFFCLEAVERDVFDPLHCNLEHASQTEMKLCQPHLILLDLQL